MKKSLFLKSVLAAFLLLAVSSSMVSCQSLADAFFGEVDNPTPSDTSKDQADEKKTNENLELTSTGAKITASSASDATAQLETLVDDIKAKGVGEGKEYVIEVVGDAVQASTDITLTIPMVKDANLNLKFDEAFGAGTTLNINASETNSESTKSANSLVITLPSSGDNLSLNVNMPETTVSLKSSGSKITYKEVKSRTALNTLVIDDEVEVDTMEIQGGTIQVNDGGILESWVFSAENNGDQVNVTEEGGIEPIKVFTTDENGNSVEQWQIASENGDPYYAQSLKIVKGAADYATAYFRNASYNTIPLKTVVVGDGTVLRTNWVAMENIEGEGTAEIKYKLIAPTSYTDDTEWGGEKFYEFNSDMSGVKNLKNIIFSQPEIEVPSGSSIETELNEKIAEGYIMHEPRINMDVNGVVEGCTFKFNHIHFCQERSLDCPTVKNCKFVHVESQYSDEDIIEMRLPYKPGSSSNSITFDGCDFSSGTKFLGGFFGNFGFDGDEIQYTGYVNFNNCTMGGEPFTGDNKDFIKSFGAVTGTKFIISFDDVPKYEVVWDSEHGGFAVNAL